MNAISIPEILAAYRNIRPLMTPTQIHEFSQALDIQTSVPIFHIGKILEINDKMIRLVDTAASLKYENELVAHLHFQKQETNYYILSLSENTKRKWIATSYTITNNDIPSSEIETIEIADLISNNTELDLFWDGANLDLIKRSHELSSNMHLRY
jgi:hypothetical protein